MNDMKDDNEASGSRSVTDSDTRSGLLNMSCSFKFMF